MATLKDKFTEMQDALNERFLQRDAETHGLMLALLSRHHIFVLGPPGTAKSAMINYLTSIVEGAKKFTYLLSRYTQPEELFGSVDLQALDKGVFRHVTTDKLPEAEFAYLDETWKCNSATLNTLLPFMQERVYYNGDGPMDCPLQTLMGASNELPEEDEGLAAMYDRFMLRFAVGYLKERSTFTKLLANQSAGGAPIYMHSPTITLEEIKAAQGEVAATPVNPDTIEALADVRELLGREGIVVSDRRYVQLIDILKAEAWLHGDTEVTPRTIAVAANCLWNQPDEINKVRGICLGVADPYALKVQERLEGAEELAASILNMDRSEFKTAEGMALGQEAHIKIKGALEDLGELREKSDRAEEAILRVEEMKTKIDNRVFGL